MILNHITVEISYLETIEMDENEAMEIVEESGNLI
jgi:hypothetical protein